MFGYDKPNLEGKLKFLKEVLIDCRSPTYRYKGFEYIFGVEKKDSKRRTKNFSEYASHAFNDTTTLNVCATEDHCFWFNSRRFCSPPFCSKTVKDHADTCRRPCFPGPAKKQALLNSG